MNSVIELKSNVWLVDVVSGSSFDPLGGQLLLINAFVQAMPSACCVSTRVNEVGERWSASVFRDTSAHYVLEGGGRTYKVVFSAEYEQSFLRDKC